jgi:hypothetical protein
VQLQPSVSGFVNDYLRQDRTVTAFVLKSDKSRDEKLVEFLRKPHKSFRERRQNCVTMCGDALRATGVVGPEERPERGAFFDSPQKLAEELESGTLEGLVETTVIFDKTLEWVTSEQILFYLGIPDEESRE